MALGRAPHAVVIEALRRCAFSVAPSLLPESFGIVALEAAAAAKPTIASDTGGLADVVVDGETGFLVAPGDVGGLAAALARLGGEPELRARMGEAARRAGRASSAPTGSCPGSSRHTKLQWAAVSRWAAAAADKTRARAGLRQGRRRT